MVGKLTIVALIIQTSLMQAFALDLINITQFLLATIGDMSGLSLAFLILFYDIPDKIKRRIGLKP